MALTSSQFQAWLESNSAIRCLLVEVVVNINGVETTLYLSNRNYNTGPSDTPANTTYLPYIQTSLTFNQSVPLDGTASLSYGDIAIDNTNGERDTWLTYIWANRSINIYIGDVTFSRDNFTKIYSGYVQDIASSSRNTLNISIRDLLQKLNSPITSATIGGTDQNSGQLRPLAFGEVHNITPVLISASTLTYMVHNGAIESIIEVRDNGVPITGYTVNLALGTFTLTKPPIGTITCSVQGERSAINRATGGVISHNYSKQSLTWTRSGNTATITHPTAHGFTNGMSINITESSAITTIPLGVYTINVINTTQYTITCLQPENLLAYSNSFSQWSKRAGMTVTENNALDPDGNLLADTVTNGGTDGYIYRSLALLPNTTYTLSVYAKGTGTLKLHAWDGSFPDYNSALTTLTGTLERLSYTFTTDSIISTGDVGFYVSNTAVLSRAQLEVNSSTSTYFENSGLLLGTQSGTNTISSYANTVSEIIQVIIRKYGASPVTTANVDLSTFLTFDENNQAPVGLYLTSNTNVISVCQDLAASLGAQFTSNRQGLITLVKVDSPSEGVVDITDNDIISGSLSIEQKVPVQGAIKLNYCKNWTVQTQLLTGIPEAHKIMLGLEYLSASVSDSDTIYKYSLSSEPEGKNTYLVSNTPIPYVYTEATRLLNLWRIPRYVYKLEATSKYLTVKLGDMVNLTHYRFGLSGTKHGQVVSIGVNWDTGRVNLGILV